MKSALETGARLRAVRLKPLPFPTRLTIPITLYDIHAVAFMQGAEVAGCLFRGDALKDARCRFHECDIEFEFPCDGGNFQADVAAANDQDAPACLEFRRDSIDIGNAANDIHTPKVAAHGVRQPARYSACRERELSIFDRPVSQFDTLRLPVNPGDACPEAERHIVQLEEIVLRESRVAPASCRPTDKPSTGEGADTAVRFLRR